VKKIEAIVVTRRRLQLERAYFDILKRNKKISSIIKTRGVRMREYLLKRSFDGFKRVLIRENRLRAEKGKRTQAILNGCFGYWKNDFMKESAQKKEQSQIIQRFVLRRKFQAIKKAFKDSAKITTRLQKIKKDLENTLVKKYFGILKYSTSQKKSLREKEQRLIKKRETERVNSAWISWIVLEQNNKIAEEVKRKQFRKNRLRKILKEWKQKIQRDQMNREYIKEKQRQRNQKILYSSFGKLKEDAFQSIRRKYKESCEELKIYKVIILISISENNIFYRKSTSKKTVNKSTKFKD